MSNTYKFRVENRDVKSTLITSESELHRPLIELLSVVGNDRQIKRIIGVDIERTHRYQPETGKISSKVSVLKLCAGRYCLVIHLHHFQSLPSSIASLFDLPDASFVGVGIKHCLEALDEGYGIKVRNCVDLGTMAAAVKGKQQLSGYGLVDLANEFGLLNVNMKNPGVVFSDWGAEKLSSEQVKAASIDALLSFYVGNHLLGGHML